MSRELDRVLHQPVRTRIVAMLAGEGTCDYVHIKTALSLSDGHMSTHMKELVGGGYVEVSKGFVDNKPRTTYSLSKEGKKRFSDYVKQLRALLS